MKRFALTIAILGLVASCPGNAQIDIGYDRWKLDNDRSMLEGRKKELLRSLDRIERRRARIAKALNALQNEDSRLDSDLRRLHVELRRIHLQLL